MQYRRNGFIEDGVYQPALLLGCGRKIVIHHLVDNAPHGFRMENRERHRVEKHHERNKREDGISRHTEREGVHLTVEQIGDERFAAFTPEKPFRLRGPLCRIQHALGLDRSSRLRARNSLRQPLADPSFA